MHPPSNYAVNRSIQAAAQPGCVSCFTISFTRQIAEAYMGIANQPIKLHFLTGRLQFFPSSLLFDVECPDTAGASSRAHISTSAYHAPCMRRLSASQSMDIGNCRKVWQSQSPIFSNITMQAACLHSARAGHNIQLDCRS